MWGRFMGNVSGIEFKVVCPENLDTEASGLTQRQKHFGRTLAPVGRGRVPSLLM